MGKKADLRICPARRRIAGGLLANANYSGRWNFRPELEVLEARILFATRIWTGASLVDNNWSDAANWQGGVSPVSGDDLIFSGDQQRSSQNDFAAGSTFNSLSFSGGANVATFAISGNAIVLSAGVSHQGSGEADLFLTGITLAGDQSFTTQSYELLGVYCPIDLNGHILTLDSVLAESLDGGRINGVIGGTGGIVKDGPGSWGIGANNAYTGLTLVNQGTLAVSAPSGLGSAAADSATVVNAGATLQISTDTSPFQPSFNLTEPLTLNGNGIPGNGATGSVVILNSSSVAPTFSGAIALGSASTIFAQSGNSAVAGLELQGAINTNGFQLSLDGNLGVDLSGTVFGNGSVIQNGQALTGIGTVNGALTVNQGTVTPGSGTSGILTTGAVTLNPGTSFVVGFNGPAPGVGFGQLNAKGAVNLNGVGLNASLKYTPAPGTSFPIIQSTGPISGAFAGMPEGSIVKLSGQPYQIRYVNGPTGGQVLLTTPSFIATGADQGGGPDVRIFDPAGALVNEIVAYNPAFTGGVRVAVGDVTGDLIPDIITAPGPSGGPDIRVFDGQTGALIREFMAYNPAFTGGVNVATADLNGDGKAEIITAADATGGPDIRIFDGATGVMIREIIAYNPAFTGGVRIAVGDIDHDGIPDIITSPGIGGGPDIRVFSGGTGAMIREIVAYNPTFTGGVYVAAADLNHDGHAEIITSPGIGGGPDVRIFAGSTGAWIGQFEAYAPGFTGGVRVAAVDVNLDGTPDIITSPGVGGGPDVRAFDGTTFGQVDEFFAYNPAFTGGVYVGGK